MTDFAEEASKKKPKAPREQDNATPDFNVDPEAKAAIEEGVKESIANSQFTAEVEVKVDDAAKSNEAKIDSRFVSEPKNEAGKETKPEVAPVESAPSDTTNAPAASATPDSSLPEAPIPDAFKDSANAGDANSSKEPNTNQANDDLDKKVANPALSADGDKNVSSLDGKKARDEKDPFADSKNKTNENADSKNPWGAPQNKPGVNNAKGNKATPKATPKANSNDKPAGVNASNASNTPGASSAAGALGDKAGKAGAALDAAKTAKDLTQKDPNAGAGGKKAKAAGAMAGAQAALDGFNDGGGLKGAAAQGAAGAVKGTREANAKAASKNSGEQNTSGKAEPGKIKQGAKLAMSATKAAIVAFLAGFTGIAPEVWARIISFKVLGTALLASFVPFILAIAAIFGGSVFGGVGQPSDDSNEQAIEYVPLGWQQTLKTAAEDTRREEVPVPWPVLAGLAKVSTDFGRTSPYDETPIDHDPVRKYEIVKESPDPENVDVSGLTPEEMKQKAKDTETVMKMQAGNGFNSSCVARPSVPAIGGEGAQGVGPFLLTPQAAEEMSDDGKDPHNACQTAEWVAKKLSAEAAVTLAENPDLVNPWTTTNAKEEEGAVGTRAENNKFWVQVIANSQLFQDASGQGTSGQCIVPPAPTGVTYPVSYLIEQIWNCEITNANSLHVVANVTVGDDGVAKFTEIDASRARSTVIAEANSVSYAFSNWDVASCDAGADLAGIFPLDKTTASTYGVTDRCDIQQSISGAAKAFLAVEKTAPETRSSELGPYQPMMGGWLNIPGVFAGDKDNMLKNGPTTNWKATPQCLVGAKAYLDKVTPQLGEFSNIVTDNVLIDVPAWEAKLNAAEDFYTTFTSLQLFCAGSSELNILGTISGLANDKAEALEGTAGPVAPANPATPVGPVAPGTVTPTLPGIPTGPEVDPDVYHGIALFFEAKREIILNERPAATFGVNSVVTPRLSGPASLVQVPFTGNFRIAGTTSTSSEKALDYAIFYGGVTEPFDSVGLRTGSLVQSQTVGTGVGLAESDIPADLVPLFLQHGQRCELVTPSLLAAQAKSESNFNSNAVSPVGAIGLSQFMPATWAAVAIDGNDDGKIDPRDPADAIASQAKYMCDMLGNFQDGGRYSDIPGDKLTLALASYNAGIGNVSKYKGVPPFKETRDYIERITKYTLLYSTVASAPTGGNYAPDGCPTVAPAGTMRNGSDKISLYDLCAKSVSQARSPEAAGAIKYILGHLGLPYSQPKRNLEGWYDCSSYTTRSYQAAGVNIAPPGQNAPSTRTMRVARWAIPISYAEVMPGDLVQPTSGHVTMALADGWFVHTASPGDVSHVRGSYKDIYWAAWVDPTKV